MALYSGLVDLLARPDGDGNPSMPVILTSSLSGSQRNLQQSYQDVMAIVAKHGKPDLFLTYTCNNQRAMKSQVISDQMNQLKVDQILWHESTKPILRN